MVGIKSQALSLEDMARIKREAMKKLREIERKLDNATGEERAKLLTMKVAEENLVKAMKYAMEHERYVKRLGLPKRDIPPIPYMEDIKSWYIDEDESWSRITTLRRKIHNLQNRIYRLKKKKGKRGVYGEILFLNCRVSLLRRELRLHYLILSGGENRDE